MISAPAKSLAAFRDWLASGERWSTTVLGPFRVVHGKAEAHYGLVNGHWLSQSHSSDHT